MIEVIMKNEVVLQKLYKSFTHAKKKWITLDEIQAFITKIDLNCSVLMVGAMYAESMMTVLDNMSDPIICRKMKYVEFLVFLCRVSHEHYESTEHKAEQLYKKLDHLLPKFLLYANLDPAYIFGDKFAAELKFETKKYLR